MHGHRALARVGLHLSQGRGVWSVTENPAAPEPARRLREAWLRPWGSGRADAPGVLLRDPSS